MTYLSPPPTPAPVIVMKDVGGFVSDYQAQTELYRMTGREVRIHECHSACTLALSLPNVCVYPDSIFKFHQAYNLRNHQTDFGVSEQLFESYPATVRARLGTLTRKFKVLSGAELISLGVRDCNTPRIMLAAKEPALRQSGTLSNVWGSVISGFGNMPTQTTGPAHAPTIVATRQQTAAERNLPAEAIFASVPLPPPRPTSEEIDRRKLQVAEPQLAETQTGAAAAEAPLPPPRPTSLAIAFTQTMPPITLPKVIQGAQPILPPHFLAYAMIARLSR
ncbi:MAG: hypothetical protein WCF20_03040 [Methylovirgula sp.]